MWSQYKNTGKKSALFCKMWNFFLWSMSFFFSYISLKAQGEQNNSSASSNMGSCTFGPLGKFFHFVEVKGWEALNGNKNKFILLRVLHSGAKVYYALKSLLGWGLNLQAQKHKRFLNNGFGICSLEEEEIRISKVPATCKGTCLILNCFDAFREFLQHVKFWVFWNRLRPLALKITLILPVTMAFLPG